MYTYEEAFQSTLQYFNGDELAAKVWVDKYSLRNNEDKLLEKTPSDMHHRIAREFARIEAKKFKNPLSEESIYGLLDKFKYIVPQGSPMFGIGNNYQIVSLSNCYLLESPLDSYSSILDVDKQLVNICKRRGGVGIDLDNLRPSGSFVKNAARSSSGISSWMERYSNSIREVGQSGRRGALMLSLSVHYPDILTFCNIKNDPTKVTGANISVKLSREFVEAVENDTEYELRWPVNSKNPTISKKIRARAVWDVIIHSAWLRAEPGILAWYNVTENTPADCYETYKSIGTNPCSEVNLSMLDSCRLLCLNLFNYVVNPFTKYANFNFALFLEHSKIAQRLMDDLVDLESEKIDKIIEKLMNDPEPEEVKRSEIEMWRKIKKFNNEGRRTGTGITALGDTIAALNIKYGSEKSIEITNEIYTTLKFGCYLSSVEMAKELGPFKEWDYEKEKDCPFLTRFKDEVCEYGNGGFDIRYINGEWLYNEMKKYGRRNISLLTTAPTGSVSCLTQTSSGIEPVFMLSYTRRKKINPTDKNSRTDFIDQNGDHWQEFTVYHPKVQLWMDVTGETDVTKSPWHGCCAEEIDWVNRVKLQAAAQKHVCHAISSTINLPEDVSKEKIAEIYLTAFKSGCKGMTVYRKNCRSGVLIEKKTETKDAPKRPKQLPCDIFVTKVKKDSFFVIVGQLNRQPYECFAGKLDGLSLDNHTKGIVEKQKRGHYNLLVDGQIVIENLCNHLTDSEEIITRLISTGLRHQVNLEFLIHQIEKSSGELISFGKAIARILKKYLKDGSEIKGEECPNCSAKLIRQEGCVTCSMGCGYSKCG